MLIKDAIKTKFSTLYIVPEALKRIMYYAQAADGEVSGLGTITMNEKKQLIVNKVYLLEQESSAGDTELKPEAISQLMTSMLQGNEDPGCLKFWWHSHGNMGVFWSGTDDTCAETLSKEYAFSLVVNKNGEIRCRLDLYHPFRLTIDNLRVKEIVEEDSQLKEECKKEIEEKVKTPTYGGNYNIENYGRGYHRGIQEQNWRGNYYGNDYSRNAKTNVTLKEVLVDDIKRLIKISEGEVHTGGVFGTETWDEYIQSTLLEVLQKRFNEKSNCNNFATWGELFTTCDDCRSVKACKFWTKILGSKNSGIQIIEDLSTQIIE